VFYIIQLFYFVFDSIFKILILELLLFNLLIEFDQIFN